jgi:hypothetical protein
MTIVKIIKSTFPTMWYNDLIGEVYNVKDHTSEFWEIKDLKESNITHLVERDSEGLAIYKVDTIIITRKHKLEKIINKINEV